MDNRQPFHLQSTYHSSGRDRSLSCLPQELHLFADLTTVPLVYRFLISAYRVQPGCFGFGTSAEVIIVTTHFVVSFFQHPRCIFSEPRAAHREVSWFPPSAFADRQSFLGLLEVFSCRVNPALHQALF